MNYKKLTEQLKVYEEKRADLINQFKELIDEIGSFIEREYNIRPNANKFADWFINNHTSIFKKKRRVPFRLTREYIFEFCSEYQKELAETALSQKIPTHIYSTSENTYRDKVEKVFEEYIPKMEAKVETYTLLKLITDASHILFYEELPDKIDKLVINEFDAKRESIRYLFYQVYLLNKTKKIKRLIVDYLLKKFDALSNNETETLLKKLSNKPQHFDKVK